MLNLRGQENLVHSRPAAGKALLPKTPSNFQTPRTTNRAPLGAKTTNAKAQNIFRDNDNSKQHAFKTPAPGQRRVLPEKSANRPSTVRRSGKAKINVAPTEPAKVEVVSSTIEYDEPDFGYAPPTPIELPDPPMEFGYDQTFPQFQPENMFLGYGQIYHASPKDENGFSIRRKKEEEEYRKYQEEQEQALLKETKAYLQKPIELSDDELRITRKKPIESKPDTIKSRSAASALSTFRAPPVASKQTASSRLKMSKPIQPKQKAKTARDELCSPPRPLSVSKNTIGFPKARRPQSIIPDPDYVHDDHDEMDMLTDELSDFEFNPIVDDDEDVFQLPMPE